MSNFLAVKTNFKNTFRFLRNFYIAWLSLIFSLYPHLIDAILNHTFFFYPKPRDFVRGPTDFVRGPKDFVQNQEILSQTQRFCPKPEDFVQTPKILSKDPKICLPPLIQVPRHILKYPSIQKLPQKLSHQSIYLSNSHTKISILCFNFITNISIYVNIYFWVIFISFILNAQFDPCFEVVIFYFEISSGTLFR